MKWNTVQVVRVCFLFLIAFYISSCAANTPNQALHVAARQGRTEMAMQLISQGTNVNSKSPAGYTPLHLAAEEGHIGTSEMLISQGADVNAKTARTGDTPLHLAAKEGKTEVIMMLISHGADVNARNRKGYSPLGAVLFEWRECIKAFYPSDYPCQKYKRAIMILQQYAPR